MTVSELRVELEKLEAAGKGNLPVAHPTAQWLEGMRFAMEIEDLHEREVGIDDDMASTARRVVVLG